MHTTNMRHEHTIRPLGWENDPEEERYPFIGLDYITVQSYNNYALFFKLEDHQREQAVSILKQGLERTLSQARHFVGTIERNPGRDDHSFVKKKDSSVSLYYQFLDSSETNLNFSSLEKQHFIPSALGDISILSAPGFMYGDKPECHPDAHPTIAAFQANFISGGLIFNMHHIHYANDLMGWVGFVHQLAKHCSSIAHNTPPPPWDSILLDRSRFTSPDMTAESKLTAPPAPDRNPSLPEFSLVHFHLPKTKAAELKALATPSPSSSPSIPWISTYDAFTAYLWRTITKHRHKALYPATPLSTPLFFAEAINMRPRLSNPPCHPHTQGNLYFGAMSLLVPDPAPLTLSQVIASESEVPLSTLATYIRKLTNSTTQDTLDEALKMAAPVQNKGALCLSINSLPVMTILITDWRESSSIIESADFGFGKPVAWRHLMGDVRTENFNAIYPARSSGEGVDGEAGPEFILGLEKDIVKEIVRDPEWIRYFEFRGFEGAGSVVEV